MRRLFVTISLVLASMPLFAQGSLRAGMVRDGGNAEIYARTGQGGFRPGYASSSQWFSGISASGRKTSRKTTFEGTFGFEQMWGTKMLTSMLVNPGYFPVDVLELTPGDKSRQTYSFSGGIGTDLSPLWVLGGKVSFSASNYAKMKDLRYTNYALDISVEPSVGYRLGGGIIQLSYIHRKVSETIDAEQVGSATDQSYYAFFDKGMRYGAYEVWDGAGVHLNEAGVGLLPIVERSDGAGIEYVGKSFRASLRGLGTNGLVGEKGYNWFRFPGWTVEAKASGNMPMGTLRGNWSLSASVKADRLDEAAMDRQTVGGVTVPVIYAYDPVSERLHSQVLAGFGVAGAKWRLRATAAWMGWAEQSYLRYPYTDRLNFNMWRAGFSGDATFGIVDAGLTTGFRVGSSREQGLKTVGELLPAEPPFRLQSDWDRKMEYLGVPCLSLGASASVRIPPVSGLRIIADLLWEHGFGVRLLPGSNRLTASVRVAYGF